MEQWVVVGLSGVTGGGASLVIMQHCPDSASGISTVMESSETTSTVNALGLIPLFSLECRVVLAEVQCGAVQCWRGWRWQGCVGWREGERGAGWWRRLD